jgi:hypothetical protein
MRTRLKQTVSTAAAAAADDDVDVNERKNRWRDSSTGTQKNISASLLELPSHPARI